VLAIDPTHRGFGFAVLEDPGGLIDWGTRLARGPKNPGSLRAVKDLLRLYQPDTLAIEDLAAAQSRRCGRVRQLLRSIARVAEALDLEVVAVSPEAWRVRCAGFKDATKEQVAAALALRFPELASRIPPHRKPWMSEDSRMTMFDAAALAIAAMSTTPTDSCPWDH
jgi:Holliday junction resolvasome RuvABC endonuclease subunit